MDTTRASLLDRVRADADDDSWRELVAIYQPLLTKWARRTGVAEHDVADLVQEVLAILFKENPRFQRERVGSFRTWLRTILSHRIYDQRARRARDTVVDRALARPAAVPDFVEAFDDQEYEVAVCRRAMQVMKTDFAPSTWKACWEFVAMGRPASEVAKELGISENAVYLAKLRVVSRLRQTLNGLLE